MWPSNLTTRYLSKRNENIRLCKDLFSNVLASFVYSSQKLETTLSAHQLMNRQANYGIQVQWHAIHYEKGQIIDSYDNMDAFQIILLSEKRRRKGKNFLFSLVHWLSPCKLD